jgi:hypothetical protein
MEQLDHSRAGRPEGFLVKRRSDYNSIAARRIAPLAPARVGQSPLSPVRLSVGKGARKARQPRSPNP